MPTITRRDALFCALRAAALASVTTAGLPAEPKKIGQAPSESSITNLLDAHVAAIHSARPNCRGRR